jgi:hypothetical protein
MKADKNGVDSVSDANIPTTLSPTTGAFSPTVKTALLDTPLKATIGPDKFKKTAGGDKDAIALNT